EKQMQHEYLYWEFPEYGGQVAVRMGVYKALCKNLAQQDKLLFELYDLEKDPDEQNNIAHEHPEILEQMYRIVKKEHVTSWNEMWHQKVLGDN
ncbi:MAG: hypothetical protein JEZ14_22400, partial [Marinilabiliaceae bacterium]|nr:hypothetical protein [Marinilabiliaceae bacterium]